MMIFFPLNIRDDLPRNDHTEYENAKPLFCRDHFKIIYIFSDKKYKSDIPLITIDYLKSLIR